MVKTFEGISSESPNDMSDLRVKMKEAIGVKITSDRQHQCATLETAAVTATVNTTREASTNPILLIGGYKNVD
jgi:hypothetical protein